MHPRAEDYLRAASPHALMVPWEGALMAQFGVKSSTSNQHDTLVLVHDETILEARKIAKELGLEPIINPRKTYICDRYTSTTSYSLGKVYIDMNGYHKTCTARLILIPMSWAGIKLFDVQIPDNFFEDHSPNHVCTIKLPSLCKALLRLATRGNKVSDYTAVYGSQLRNVLLSQVYGETWRDVLVRSVALSEAQRSSLQKGLTMLRGWEFDKPEERVTMEKIIRDRIPISEFFKQSRL